MLVIQPSSRAAARQAGSQQNKFWKRKFRAKAACVGRAVCQGCRIGCTEVRTTQTPFGQAELGNVTGGGAPPFQAAPRKKTTKEDVASTLSNLDGHCTQAIVCAPWHRLVSKDKALWGTERT